MPSTGKSGFGSPWRRSADDQGTGAAGLETAAGMRWMPHLPRENTRVEAGRELPSADERMSQKEDGGGWLPRLVSIAGLASRTCPAAGRRGRASMLLS